MINPNIFPFPEIENPMTNRVTAPCTEGMPYIFRLTSVTHRQEERCIRYTAHLYHDKAAIKVEWTRNQPDIRLRPFSLVSPRWKTRPTSINGALQISRLVLMEHPEPEENLFRMVPSGCGYSGSRTAQ